MGAFHIRSGTDVLTACCSQRGLVTPKVCKLFGGKTRLIILLALLIGVLYCIHLLVKDYQAVTGSRLLRALFKRDLQQQNYSKPNVRWKKILQFDPIQCARYFYCAVGASRSDSEVRRGFIYMLTLEPRDGDRSSQEVFKVAYQVGVTGGEDGCRSEYHLCPFHGTTLFELVHFLLHNHTEVHYGVNGYLL